jgi:hypothetical protein
MVHGQRPGPALPAAGRRPPPPSRHPTKTTIVPKRKILIVHLDIKAVLMPTISVVSQPVRIEAIPLSGAESSRSKSAPSAP